MNGALTIQWNTKQLLKGMWWSYVQLHGNTSWSAL